MSMIGKTVHYESPPRSGNYVCARVSGEYKLENCSSPSQNIQRLMLENGNEITLDRAYLMKSCPQPTLSGN